MRSLLVLCCLLGSLSAVEDNKRPAALLAALTSERPSLYEPAAQALIRMGDVIVPDLALLIRDKRPSLRSRVAQVLGSIGGQRAIEAMLPLMRDPDATVRSFAVLAMGQAGGRRYLEQIRDLLSDQDAGVREAAALTLSLMPDVSSVVPLLQAMRSEQSKTSPDPQEQLRRGRALAAMKTTLRGIIADPRTIPALAELLPHLRGYDQAQVLEATWAVGDPRYGSALQQILVSDQFDMARLAAIALAANGDSRQVQALCQVASRAERNELREEAAIALRVLTGYRSGPGPVWELWWRDNAEQVRALYPRDAFIAKCHDPDFRPTRQDLAAFTPEELEPLIRGVFGSGAPHWPRLAYRVFKQDDPKRWFPWLRAEWDETSSETERVALLMLLADMDLKAVRPDFKLRLLDLQQQREAELEEGRLVLRSEIATLEALLSL